MKHEIIMKSLKGIKIDFEEEVILKGYLVIQANIPRKFSCLNEGVQDFLLKEVFDNVTKENYFVESFIDLKPGEIFHLNNKYLEILYKNNILHTEKIESLSSHTIYQTYIYFYLPWVFINHLSDGDEITISFKENPNFKFELKLKMPTDLKKFIEKFIE